MNNLRILGLLIVLMITSHTINSQVVHAKHPNTDQEDHTFRHWRVAVLLGHTLIPAAHEELVFIPSWGLDTEYWFGMRLGLGIHTDAEIEQFIVKTGREDETIERVTPLVVTMDALWKPWRDLVVVFGPGLEFEKNEHFPLIRFGLEYEFEVAHHLDISPAIVYDDRLDGYQTWSIMLGVGKRF